LIDLVLEFKSDNEDYYKITVTADKSLEGTFNNIKEASEVLISSVWFYIEKEYKIHLDIKKVQNLLREFNNES
jgi:hypothetical protein